MNLEVNNEQLGEPYHCTTVDLLGIKTVARTRFHILVQITLS